MPRIYSSKSIPYTAAPIQLIIEDLALWFRITFVLPPAGLPSIIFPIGPFNSGSLDELHPTFGNLWAITRPHRSDFRPGWVFSDRFACRFWRCASLDQWREYVSRTELITFDDRKRFDREKWIFVNGVAAGRHWMQSNLDRLALTFRREIVGIHNETRGVVFDLVECILERTLGWATPSTRTVYARLLEFISDDTHERVVLILHSQGAIEGGLALDWLFATVPPSILGKVEVYTFGAAANHFNNPSFNVMDDSGQPMPSKPDEDGRILKHIEHYANSDDYVSQFGILNYRPKLEKMGRLIDPTRAEKAQNMFAGRLFIRKASGHQFNNNYLDKIFTLNPDRNFVLDNNPFIDAEIDESQLALSDIVTVRVPIPIQLEDFSSDNVISASSSPSISSSSPSSSSSTSSPSTSLTTSSLTSSKRSITKNKSSSIKKPAARNKNKAPEKTQIDVTKSTRTRVRDLSRLWEYRNGGIPLDK